MLYEDNRVCHGPQVGEMPKQVPGAAVSSYLPVMLQCLERAGRFHLHTRHC